MGGVIKISVSLFVVLFTLLCFVNYFFNSDYFCTPLRSNKNNITGQILRHVFHLETFSENDSWKDMIYRFGSKTPIARRITTHYTNNSLKTLRVKPEI